MDDSRQIANLLDEAAAGLSEIGYTVERVPFLAVIPPRRRPGEADEEREEPDQPRPMYPALTYNNVLLVNGEQGGRVYLPRYGLAGLDDVAERRWRELGFEVHPVAGLTTSAMYGGSLRCSVKVIERAPGG